MAWSLSLGGTNAPPSTTRPAGPDEIVVTGAGTTLKLMITGVRSTFSTRSTARMRNVCGPGSRPSSDSGELQDSHRPESSWHSNVTSSCGVALSEPVNATSSTSKRGAGTTGISGSGGFCEPTVAGSPLTSVVTGGVVSAVIVQVYVAGVGSTLPSKFGFGEPGLSVRGSAMSRARTSKVCCPGAT